MPKYRTPKDSTNNAGKLEENSPMEENKTKALQAALAQIEKQFGKGSIMRMDSEAVTDIVSRLVGRETTWGVDPAVLSPAHDFVAAHKDPAFLEKFDLAGKTLEELRTLTALAPRRAANYAGMKFYRNLRHTVRIGDAVRPALAGVARESVSRTVSDWRRQGLIEVMGRNAGWLTAACGLAAEASSAAQPLLLFPEHSFDETQFLQAVERAVAMSHDKYCSASIMLAKTAEITTSFEVLEA